jgi:hypothetical protein
VDKDGLDPVLVERFREQRGRHRGHHPGRLEPFQLIRSADAPGERDPDPRLLEPVASEELAGDLLEVEPPPGDLEVDQLAGTPQPVEVLVPEDQAATMGAERLVHRVPVKEAAVEDRHPGAGLGEVLAVEEDDPLHLSPSFLPP